MRRQASERESVDCTPPEYVLPGSKDRPLPPLQPVREDWKVSCQLLYMQLKRAKYALSQLNNREMTAFAVPAGPDPEQLEPTSGKQEDAR